MVWMHRPSRNREGESPQDQVRLMFGDGGPPLGLLPVAKQHIHPSGAPDAPLSRVLHYGISAAPRARDRISRTNVFRDTPSSPARSASQACRDRGSLRRNCPL